MDPFKKLREDTDLCLMHLIVICTHLLPYNWVFFRGGGVQIFAIYYHQNMSILIFLISHQGSPIFIL